MTDTAKQQSTACFGCCDVPCDCTCHKAADNQNKHEISGITADETDSLGRPTIESLLEVQADLRAEITDLERSLQEAQSRIEQMRQTCCFEVIDDRGCGHGDDADDAGTRQTRHPQIDVNGAADKIVAALDAAQLIHFSWSWLKPNDQYAAEKADVGACIASELQRIIGGK